MQEAEQAQGAPKIQPSQGTCFGARRTDCGEWGTLDLWQTLKYQKTLPVFLLGFMIDMNDSSGITCLNSICQVSAKKPIF